MAPALLDPEEPETAAPPMTTAQPDSSDRRWYGWQTALADLASLGIIALGLEPKTGPRKEFTAGVISFALASPIIHLFHGESRHAGASLVLHVVLPAIALVTSPRPESSADLGVFYLTLAAAPIIDSALISWKSTGPRVTSTQPDSSDRRWYGWQTGLADLASLGIIAVGLDSGPRKEFTAGVVSFCLASPIIHLAHREPYHAAASLVLHVLVPLVAFYMAPSIPAVENGRDYRLFYLTLAAVPIIDSALISWSRHPLLVQLW